MPVSIMFSKVSTPFWHSYSLKSLVYVLIRYVTIKIQKITINVTQSICNSQFDKILLLEYADCILNQMLYMLRYTL